MTAISPLDRLQQQAKERGADSAPGSPLGTGFESGEEHRKWRSMPAREGTLGFAAVVLLMIAVSTRLATVGRPLDAETLTATIGGIAGIVLAAALGILSYGHYSLRYQLNPGAITIKWLWMQERIPLASIEAIYRGTRLGDKAKVKGIVWQGYGVGTAAAEGIGFLKFFGTSRDPSHAIILATTEGAYALTPSDLEGFRSELIAMLDAIPEGEMATGPESRTVRRYLPRISPLEMRKAILWTAGITLGSVLLWSVLRIPVDIPGANSGSGASSMAEVNDWASAGQSLRMDRSGLSRIDVPLATLKRTSAANLQFYVREDPDGPNLRSLKMSLDDLPEGKVLDLYKIRWQDLPWVSFEFEPVEMPPGKPLYFNVEGKDIPRENTVQILFTYKNSYGQGEGYRSEKPADANMVFRSYARGSLADLLDMTFGHMAEKRTGPLGLKSLYYGITGIGLALVAVLSVTLVGLFRHTPHQ